MTVLYNLQYICENDGDLELYLTWTPTWPTSSKGTLRLVVEMHSVYTVRNLRDKLCQFLDRFRFSISSVEIRILICLRNEFWEMGIYSITQSAEGS